MIVVRGFDSRQGAGNFFSSPPWPDGLWVLPSLLYNGYRGSFPEAWSWPLTSISCCGQRMRGAIPPPQYAFTAWCSVKHRGTFTFYMSKIFQTEHLKGRDHLGDLSLDGKECGMTQDMVSGGLTRQWDFGFHDRWRIPWTDERSSVSHKGTLHSGVQPYKNITNRVIIL
jgi:hypothetical protein